MKGSSLRAPPIECRDPESFGGFTVRERFPKIMAQARAGLEPARAADARFDELLDDVVSGRAIRMAHFAHQTEYWRSYLQALRGRSWSELSFFETEFCFYQAINSLAGAFDSEVDVFAHVKSEALEAAVRSLESRPYEFLSKTSLGELVMSATIGNVADASQLAAHGDVERIQSLIVDDSAGLSQLLSAPLGAVHWLLDNAGAELCADLALVDRLITTTAARVVLHAKPWPMFVSDALLSDVDNSLARFSYSESSELRALGRRLQVQREAGRLSLRAPSCWGEPRHFFEVPSDLAAELRSATVVVAKGDLNYRRFIEDRAWPADTPLSLANTSSFSAYALRVLKSEALAGISTERARALSQAEPDYRISARHAMVQYLPCTVG